MASSATHLHSQNCKILQNYLSVTTLIYIVALVRNFITVGYRASFMPWAPTSFNHRPFSLRTLHIYLLLYILRFPFSMLFIGFTLSYRVGIFADIFNLNLEYKLLTNK